MNKLIIPAQFNQIHLEDFAFDEVSALLVSAKEHALQRGDQMQMKDIWISEQILRIHQRFRKAFYYLVNAAYYKAWCELECTERLLKHLKNHFIYDKKSYRLWHIEKSIYQFQIIYPYRTFVAADVIKAKRRCSICEKEISIHNLCAHEEGEIYNGEICKRISQHKEVIKVGMTDHPDQKFNVVFFRDDEKIDSLDLYDYRIVGEFITQIKSPYQEWDLIVEEKIRRPEDYAHLSKNDACKCGSGRTYLHCCSTKIGERYAKYHCEIVKDKNAQKKSKF